MLFRNAGEACTYPDPVTEGRTTVIIILLPTLRPADANRILWGVEVRSHAMFVVVDADNFLLFSFPSTIYLTRRNRFPQTYLINLLRLSILL